MAQQGSGTESAVTMATVGKLTTFELRQELVRRNALDIPEDRINHRTMLERLVKDLVAEEQRRAETQLAAAEKARNEDREKERLIREQRKQEALERSRQRQANPDYFRTKTEANAAEIAAKAADSAASNAATEEEDQDSDGPQQPLDPFRPYQSKTRSKLFIK